MTNLLDVDLTQLNMDELTELRDKCNAKLSRPNKKDENV